MIWGAAALMGLATLLRGRLALQEPAPWRVALTGVLGFLTLGIISLAGAEFFDQHTRRGVALLARHVLLTLSAGCGLIYVGYMRRKSLGRTARAWYVGMTILVCVAQAWLWAISDLTAPTRDYSMLMASQWSFVGHDTLFYAWQIMCLIYTAYFCWRYASAPDLAQRVGLQFIGLGCASGALVFTASLWMVWLEFLLGADVRTASTTVRALTVVPLCLIVCGVISLVMIPMAQEWIRSTRTLAAVSSLHDHLVRLHPQVRLSSTSVRGRTLRTRRAIIEIHDALALSMIPDQTPRTPEGLAEAVFALDSGNFTSSSDVNAGSVLSAISGDEDDLACLVDVGTAFTRLEGQRHASRA